MVATYHCHRTKWTTYLDGPLVLSPGSVLVAGPSWVDRRPPSSSAPSLFGRRREFIGKSVPSWSGGPGKSVPSWSADLVEVILGFGRRTLPRVPSPLRMGASGHTGINVNGPSPFSSLRVLDRCRTYDLPPWDGCPLSGP